MRHRHRPHDGQAQPGTGLRFAGSSAYEALLHGILFVIGNARPAVGHGQRHPESRHGRGLDVHGAVRRIAQRVVHQVAQHFTQGHAIARDARPPHLRRDLDAQPLGLQRSDAAPRFIDGLGHAHRRPRPLAQPVRDGGVHQQLIDELAGMHGVQVDAPQSLVQALGIGFVQRHLGLRPQRSQRCAHLVRRVGDQRVQRIHQPGQPLHERIERLDQPPHFGGHGRDQRRQVIRRPPPQLAFHHGQRRKGPLHPKPQEAQRHQ
ncbi:hypothetical protein LMG3481_03369 [Achromobacter deleyi]|nr:hypothetical protein LMG3481_03369 [Achromobacter deleyi]